ncbi:glycosyltransferase family 22 protein [Backusella circina FSU 941]|nr:glycosyltransferase family 22 protein [Backusella circina FSU 941]
MKRRRCSPAKTATRDGSALYRIPTDYDEIYNYWEPTHYLLEGYGRETWEYSLDYKTKSWAFIFVNSLIGFISKIFVSTKLQTFYLIRMLLATVCSFAEARFYRTIVEEINPHVGRYVFCILFFAAGMFNASTAYLSHSFSMCCVFMAFSYSLRPPSEVDRKRVYKVVFWLVLGSLVGWPMTALIGIPFGFEEVMVFGRDTTKDKNGRTIRCIKSPNWRLRRTFRLVEAIVITTAGITFILVLMDQIFYRTYTVVTWNYIRYHILEHGLSYYIPTLDKTTTSLIFHLWDGFLNFNIAFILALVSAGCTIITAFVDRNRVPGSTKMDMIWPYILLGLKLTPFYLWFIIFSLQSYRHNDDSVIMYVSYPALTLNAAISVYLIRSLAGRFAGLLGANPNTRVFVLRYTSMAILMVFSLLSVSRIFGILTRYRAPLIVYSSIFSEEQLPDQITNLNYIQETYPDNLSIYTKNVCVTDKEWYRFPSQFFLPSDTRLQFIKSKHNKNVKTLPNTFTEDFSTGTYILDDKKYEYRRRKFLFEGARTAPLGLNNIVDQEDPTAYVKENQCDYLIDTNFPLSQENDGYIRNTRNWKTLGCYPYLDYENSHVLSRDFWIPGSPGLVWGDYCMLKRKMLLG